MRVARRRRPQPSLVRVAALHRQHRAVKVQIRRDADRLRPEKRRRGVPGRCAPRERALAAATGPADESPQSDERPRGKPTPMALIHRLGRRGTPWTRPDRPRRGRRRTGPTDPPSRRRTPPCGPSRRGATRRARRAARRARGCRRPPGAHAPAPDAPRARAQRFHSVRHRSPRASHSANAPRHRAWPSTASRRASVALCTDARFMTISARDRFPGGGGGGGTAAPSGRVSATTARKTRRPCPPRANRRSCRATRRRASRARRSRSASTPRTRTPSRLSPRRGWAPSTLFSPRSLSFCSLLRSARRLLRSRSAWDPLLLECIWAVPAAALAALFVASKGRGSHRLSVRPRARLREPRLRLRLLPCTPRARCPTARASRTTPP